MLSSSVSLTCCGGPRLYSLFSTWTTMCKTTIALSNCTDMTSPCSKFFSNSSLAFFWSHHLVQFSLFTLNLPVLLQSTFRYLWTVGILNNCPYSPYFFDGDSWSIYIYCFHRQRGPVIHNALLCLLATLLSWLHSVCTLAQIFFALLLVVL